MEYHHELSDVVESTAVAVAGAATVKYHLHHLFSHRNYCPLRVHGLHLQTTSTSAVPIYSVFRKSSN